MNQRLESVVCAGCTCLCDDLTVSLEDEGVQADPFCPLANSWIARLNVLPTCRIDGEYADLSAAVGLAVDLLAQSRSPLVGGLDGLSTQSQILATGIARKLRAQVDSTFSRHGRSDILSLQKSGKVTATLGEIASRSDVVVFWNCDPLTTHPRFIERYCNTGAKILVVASEENATAKIAKQFVEVSRDDLGPFISKLRLHVAGKIELSNEALEFAATLVAARHGAMIFGQLDRDAAVYETTQSLSALIRELNQVAPYVGLALRQDANAQGAENVLAWNTGFPFAVSWLQEDAEFNGLEFSTPGIIERGECDVILICSTASLDRLHKSAHQALATATQIVICDDSEKLEGNPKIRFDVSFDEGDWCRNDNVILPVANFLDGDTKSRKRKARDVLRLIHGGL